MILYHTGFAEIERPDIHIGRKNADFGQGFYLSTDEEFSKRWARERTGEKTYLNTYELDTTGLAIKRFEKGSEWFDYIFSNRAGKADALANYDVIIGPIANDTMYDTWGLLTSGLVDEKLALRVLMIGPAYEQLVLKSEAAAAALSFVSVRVLSHEEIAAYRDVVRREEETFQEAFAAIVAAG